MHLVLSPERVHAGATVEVAGLTPAPPMTEHRQDSPVPGPDPESRAWLLELRSLFTLAGTQSLDELVVGRDPAVGGEGHELEAGAEHLAIR